MTLDKFKYYIGYNNNKLAWFLIGAMTMIFSDNIGRGDGWGALYSVIVIVALYLTQTKDNNVSNT